jgi:hypothetical protein
VPKIEVEERPGDVVLKGEDRRPDEEDEEAVEDEQVTGPGDGIPTANE